VAADVNAQRRRRRNLLRMVLLERRGREVVEGRRTTRNARVEAALLQQLRSLASYLLQREAKSPRPSHQAPSSTNATSGATTARIPIITRPQAAAPVDEEEEEVGTEEHHRLLRTRSREECIPAMG